MIDIFQDESGLYQNREWHISKWKVAYIYTEWKVAYAKMESGIYQNGKWHMPKWKVA
jgi:hypothetical protein